MPGRDIQLLTSPRWYVLSPRRRRTLVAPASPVSRAISRISVLAPTLAALTLAGCGGGDPTGAKVAAAASASNCEQSNYGIVMRLAGGKTERIYNCNFADGSVKCVTYANGIANDSTALVRLVFATKLGAGKPSCLGG